MLGSVAKLIGGQVATIGDVNKEMAKTNSLIEKQAVAADDSGGLLKRTWNWLGEAGQSVIDLAKDGVKYAAAYALNKNAIISSVISEVTSLYTELSTLTTGYAKFTGQVIKGDAAASNFSGRLIKLQRKNRLLGATIKDLTDAYTSLTKTSSTFGIVTGTNRKQNIALGDDLTEVAFRLSKVGLSTENFGTALDVLGKTYRRTDILRQSKNLGAEFVNIARVTGQSADAVAKNFSTAMEHLAAYSLPRAREEFKKLSAISATTGVEMGTVMKVASQFDDIEKTAESVGELNAMMGGPYLNTLDLVNASESERIDMLKNMMTQTGESFNQMDRFKQKAIAKTLGTDVQTASRMFSGQQKDIDSLAGSINKNAASFSQLGDAATKSVTSITEQFAATKQSTLLVNKAFKEVDSMTRKATNAFAKLGDKARHMVGGIIVGTLQSANTELSNLIKLSDDFLSGKSDGTELAAAGAKSGGKLFTFGPQGVAVKMMLDEANAQILGNKENPIGSGTTEDRLFRTSAKKMGRQIQKSEPRKKQTEGVNEAIEHLKKAAEETSKKETSNASAAYDKIGAVADEILVYLKRPWTTKVLLDGDTLATAVNKLNGVAP
jgi:hypothetical protein